MTPMLSPTFRRLGWTCFWIGLVLAIWSTIWATASEPAKPTQAATLPQRFQAVADICTTIATTLTYTSDIVLYHRQDYWASPAETLAAHAGDCEDFCLLAIKEIADAGLGHASLAVVNLDDGEGGHTYVLYEGALFEAEHPGGVAVRPYHDLQIVSYDRLESYRQWRNSFGL